MNAKRLVVSVALAAGLVGGGLAAIAQDATPAAGDMGVPPTPEGCTVIASGLVNPRYVAVADDGAIYVSEAGIGGEEPVLPPAEEGATPVAADVAPPGTRGFTGQVTRINPDGTTEVVASGLVSYANGLETIGPAGIAIAADGTILLANGGAGPAAAFTEPLEGENALLAIDPQTGETTVLADIGAAERANNPDGFAIDTNLYGIAVAEDGTVFVNDAGGNTTYRVPAGGGTPEVVAVHPGLPVPAGMEGPQGENARRGGAMELDPVPTDLVVGENDRLFSGLLSGGPFPPGAAKVVLVGGDGTLSDVSGDLTMVVGMAIGPDGHLYATQLSTNFLGEMPEPGNIVRVHSDKAPQVVLEGLFLPNGIAFDAEGNLIVVNQTVSFGPPMGQVLRCEGITARADAPEVVTIEVGDMWYSPAEFNIPADTDVTLRISNRGFATHDLTFTGLGLTSEMILAGEEVEIVVNLPAGNYAFGCDVPGHRLAGMTGVMHVGD